MKRIGLLSDTHSYIDDAVFKHFNDCDEVWHAGDFGNLQLIERLCDFKPLRGVYGNIDGADIKALFPEVLSFTCEEVKVLMVHIGGYPGKYTPLAKKNIINEKPGLFITGHSHILKVMYDQQYQCLHINPGAAGQQGWHQVKTLIKFVIDSSEIKDCKIIELGTR